MPLFGENCTDETAYLNNEKSRCENAGHVGQTVDVCAQGAVSGCSGSERAARSEPVASAQGAAQAAVFHRHPVGLADHGNGFSGGADHGDAGQ